MHGGQSSIHNDRSAESNSQMSERNKIDAITSLIPPFRPKSPIDRRIVCNESNHVQKEFQLQIAVSMIDIQNNR